MVEAQHKIVLEVCWYTTAILGCIAHDSTFVRHNRYGRTLVKGIYNEISFFCLWIGDTHCSSTTGRTHLCCDVVVNQINLIIIRSSSLSFVREPAGTSFLVKDFLTNDRHDRELSVVVNPWTWLMCLLDSANLIGSVGVSPAISHLSSLWSPEVHAPW